ncbi:MAG: AI-2E family transporter [Candidatus Omnitrophica bacterium]|nr:AI-2E family transporter [Candidatus Omnitrophota bacterium]
MAMTREQFIGLFFIALLVFVVYQIFLIFAPFIQSIFWAAILAFGFYPVYEYLKKRFNIHETLAAILLTAFIFMIIVPPLVLLIVSVTSQAIELYQSTSNYIRDGHLEKALDQLRAWGPVQKIESDVSQWEPLKKTLTAWVLNSSKTLVNSTVNQVGVITKNIFFIALNIFMTTFLIFIFLKDGMQIYNFIYRIAPLEEKNKKSIFRQVNDTFSAVIRGQILTSLAQATVAGFIYWVLGIPAPVFFAAATFLATLIPVVGAANVWLPLVIYLLTLEQYIKAAVLAVLGFLVISLIDNIMKPALIGEKTKLPYFLLFFGILGGLHVYGLMGVFLAPVILSLFFVLVKIYQEKFL